MTISGATAPLIQRLLPALAVPTTPHVAMFTLIRGGAPLVELDGLRESILCARSAYRKVSTSVPDYVVFHEGNVPIEQRRSLAREIGGLRFEDVWDHGGFLPTMVPWSSAPKVPTDRSLGYRHRCDFMALRWFGALSSMGYEYAMRVDEDVCLRELGADPFAALRDSGAVYGYSRPLLTAETHEGTLQSLTPWLTDFSAEHGLGKVDAEAMFFTNFFVSRLDFWSRADVGAYLRAVEASGGIYAHRWGDAPIQTAALRLFLADRPKAVVHLEGVSYQHLSTSNSIEAGWEVPAPSDATNSTTLR